MNFSFNFFEESNELCSNSNKSIGTDLNDCTMNNNDVYKDINNDELVNEHPINMKDDILYEFFILQIDKIHNLKVIKNHASDINKNTDIITGIYEGGYKIWECSIDLTSYILNNNIEKYITSQLDKNHSKIIDLGCGHGLPGISALQIGFKYVYFSDLNKEVINETTIPNICMNCNTIETSLHAKCYSGDWLSLSKHMKINSNDNQFDLILSAETLYSEKSCNKLLYFIENHLSSIGIVLLASKRFYFGVGGGTYLIETLINEQYSTLNYKLLQTFEDGYSNIREIIMISRK